MYQINSHIVTTFTHITTAIYMHTERLIDLLKHQGWYREAVVDTVLLLCSSVVLPLQDRSVAMAFLLKIESIINVSLQDMAAWQLVLYIGIDDDDVDDDFIGHYLLIARWIVLQIFMSITIDLLHHY
jgi:hypothetical protein